VTTSRNRERKKQQKQREKEAKKSAAFFQLSKNANRHVSAREREREREGRTTHRGPGFLCQGSPVKIRIFHTRNYRITLVKTSLLHREKLRPPFQNGDIS